LRKFFGWAHRNPANPIWLSQDIDEAILNGIVKKERLVKKIDVNPLEKFMQEMIKTKKKHKR